MLGCVGLLLETVVMGALSSYLLLWLRVIPRDHLRHPPCPLSNPRPSSLFLLVSSLLLFPS